MKRSLSQIVADFRERFRLSKAKAAQVLGISTLYMRSLEQGVDVRTGLPFKPRDATLLQLAAKMTEFGYPVTFDELKVAAGMAPAEEKAPEPKPEAPKPVPAAEREPGEMHRVIDGMRKRYEPTEEEWAIIDELDRTGSWYGGFSQPGFWELPPEERESEFFYLKGLMREHRKREQGK